MCVPPRGDHRRGRCAKGLKLHGPRRAQRRKARRVATSDAAQRQVARRSAAESDCSFQERGHVAVARRRCMPNRTPWPTVPVAPKSHTLAGTPRCHGAEGGKRPTAAPYRVSGGEGRGGGGRLLQSSTTKAQAPGCTAELVASAPAGTPAGRAVGAVPTGGGGGATILQPG